MKEVIAVISRKGGTGKTTSVLALGGELQKQGQRVLLIDLDSQQNLSEAMGARLTGYSAAHLLDDTPAANTIQHTRNGDIIAASESLAIADKVITSDNDLKKAIRPILNEYDYILIDTPANFGKLVRNALTAATSAIITSHGAKFSQQGLTAIIDTVNEIRTTNTELKLRGIIITDNSARSAKLKAMPDRIRAAAVALGTEVIEPPIKHTDKVGEAQDEQINLCDYDGRCSAAKCYREIVYKILEW